MKNLSIISIIFNYSNIIGYIHLILFYLKNCEIEKKEDCVGIVYMHLKRKSNLSCGMTQSLLNLRKFFSDPRTRSWFLMSSPVPGASILIGYLYFVLSWGPRHMEHRKPYQLKNILVVYNFLQVVLSVWLFYEGLDAAWLKKYSWKCEPVDFSYSSDAMRVRTYTLG